MARYQYRIAGRLDAMSAGGNAIWALTNRAGSGKKITIRSIEINALTAIDNTATTATQTSLAVARAVIAGGELISPVKLDTNAADWPSTVRVTTDAAFSGTPGPLLGGNLVKQINSASWLARQTAIGGRFAGIVRRPRHSNTERIIVRAGEAIALYPQSSRRSTPIRVTAELIRHGTPNRSFIVSQLVPVVMPGSAILAVNNAAGSGETVSLCNVAIEEIGGFSTPYFQVVPIGSTIEAENARVPPILRMDSAHPDPLTWVDARQDLAFLPFGLPENALADFSGGSPKGFNYLKTKDFLGPTYRTFFPEFWSLQATIAPVDFVPRGQRYAEIFARKAGFTIREGEGIALVASAETAAGVTTFIDMNGWAGFDYGITFDVEQASIPTVSLSGMVNGSRWRIERVADSSLVAEGVAGVAGTATFDYTTEDTPLSLRLKVRKASTAPYYKPYEATFTLTSAGISVPVSQVVDP